MWQMDSRFPVPQLLFLANSLTVSKLILQKSIRQSKKRHRSILQQPDTTKSFPLRRLAAHESQLDLWNIRAIAVPDSPKSKGKKEAKEPAVEKFDGTSIVLDFASEQEQNAFEYCFKSTAIQRSKQVDEFDRGRRVALSQGDTPMRRTSYTPAEPRRTSMASSYTPAEPRRTSTASSMMKTVSRQDFETAPRLEPIPSFASLESKEPDGMEIAKAYC